ncbi:MAG: 30S ribosomal protein S6 [Candidatus Levyibacteriota bacterium]
MRTYNLAVIFNSSMAENARKKLLETIKSWLGKIKVTKEEEWGEKVLSYPIKREKSGFYYHLSLEGDSIPQDFEKKILNQEGVLRSLLIRKK